MDHRSVDHVVAEADELRLGSRRRRPACAAGAPARGPARTAPGGRPPAAAARTLAQIGTSHSCAPVRRQASAAASPTASWSGWPSWRQGATTTVVASARPPGASTTTADRRSPRPRPGGRGASRRPSTPRAASAAVRSWARCMRSCSGVIERRPGVRGLAVGHGDDAHAGRGARAGRRGGRPSRAPRRQGGARPATTRVASGGGSPSHVQRRGAGHHHGSESGAVGERLAVGGGGGPLPVLAEVHEQVGDPRAVVRLRGTAPRRPWRVMAWSSAARAAAATARRTSRARSLGQRLVGRGARRWRRRPRPGRGPAAARPAAAVPERRPGRPARRPRRRAGRRARRGPHPTSTPPRRSRRGRSRAAARRRPADRRPGRPATHWSWKARVSLRVAAMPIGCQEPSQAARPSSVHDEEARAVRRGGRHEGAIQPIEPEHQPLAPSSRQPPSVRAWRRAAAGSAAHTPSSWPSAQRSGRPSSARMAERRRGLRPGGPGRGRWRAMSARASQRARVLPLPGSGRASSSGSRARTSPMASTPRSSSRSRARAPSDSAPRVRAVAGVASRPSTTPWGSAHSGSARCLPSAPTSPRWARRRGSPAARGRVRPAT